MPITKITSATADSKVYKQKAVMFTIPTPPPIEIPKRTRQFDINVMDYGDYVGNEEIFYDSIQCRGRGYNSTFEEEVTTEENKLPMFIQEIADMVGVEISFREVTDEVEARLEDNNTFIHYSRADFKNILDDIEANNNVKRFNYNDLHIMNCIIDELSKDGRVCPMPLKWSKLYQLIVGMKRGEVVGNYNLEPPLILSMWHALKSSKKEVLLKHIEWAYNHGTLLKAIKLLSKFKDEDWLTNIN